MHTCIPGYVCVCVCVCYLVGLRWVGVMTGPLPPSHPHSITIPPHDHNDFGGVQQNVTREYKGTQTPTYLRVPAKAV